LDKKDFMGRYAAKKIDRILSSLIGQKRWQRGLTEAEITRNWSDLVGAKIAEHSTPSELKRGRLVVACDHDVWRTELQFLKPELLQKLESELGEGVVKEIFVK
jgi:predicted nucleic acid-binding Zn ribbon protein